MARYWIETIENDWMMLREVSDLIGIPYNTLRQAALQKRVKARKSGSFWLTKPQYVFEALEAGSIRAWDEYVEQEA